MQLLYRIGEGEKRNVSTRYVVVEGNVILEKVEVVLRLHQEHQLVPH